MPSSSQPVGVTVVAVLILIGALFSLMWAISLFTSPLARQAIGHLTSSIPVLVFVTLTNAGLSLACGIGLLAGRDWARWLYIGFTPILMFVAVMNGFRLTMLAGILQYIIFVYVLTRPHVNEYFTESSGREW